MSVLTIIRHAQASFLEEDYDRLSAVGEQQARLLGEYWGKQEIVFDAVYSGPRRRQTRTAEIAGDVVRAAGLTWPDPVLLPEFDEYQAEELWRHCLPGILQGDHRIRALHADWQRAKDTPEERRAFELVFQEVTRRWACGEAAAEQVEPWLNFRDRVRRGLGRVRSGNCGGRRVVVFTSGGPVAVAMEEALDLALDKTLDVLWMTRNGACAEFRFSGPRITLESFNTSPHLPDRSLWTWR
jgi:broad specificity phosphatase PhoE